jgi:predicted ArsR family transcriptional regulator
MPYPRDPGFKELGGPSELAAKAIAGHATTVRDRVLAFLTKRYPASFSADEIADDLGESILTVRPRVSELRRGGLIEPTADRRVNRSGMLAKCWRAAVRPNDTTNERV